ncbi:hypothetical protein FKP32DRAFT_73807 [Trametes sanguinea]|nr:hypothetical protein FKP32DRAFT_73807 [Trametes sanguinea]
MESTTHRALKTSDVLRVILLNFDTTPGVGWSISQRVHFDTNQELYGSVKDLQAAARLEQDHRRTLARCACVSTAFSQAALPILWRQLPSLVPLLRLFPSYSTPHTVWRGGRRHTVHTLHPERVPLSVLERLKYYGRLIRHIYSLPPPRRGWEPFDEIASEAWVSLSDTNDRLPGVFLPNLSHMQLTIRSSMPMQGLHSFLSAIASSLSAFDLRSRDSSFHESTQTSSSLGLPRVLVDVLSTATTLERFGLVVSDGLHLSLPAFSHIALSKSLRSINLFFRNVQHTFDALMTLASLDTLEDLTLTPGFGKDAILPQVSPLARHTFDIPLFRNLLSLHVVQNLGTTEVHHDLFRLLRSPTLHTFDIVGTSRSHPTPECLRHSCELWARYFPSLRSFSAKFWGGDPGLITDVSIGDRDVDAISRAWPQLEILDFAHLAVSPDLETPLGPSSLICLATRCPNLKCVSLPYIDLQRWTGPSSFVLRDCPVLDHGLRTLDFTVYLNYGSDYEEHMYARPIARLFPNVDVVGPLVDAERHQIVDALEFWTAAAVCQDARTNSAFY